MSETTELPPAADAEAPATEQPGGRRSLKRATRIRLIVIGAVAVIAAVAIATYYLYTNATYVSTDNAQVDGDKISVNAPATGTLLDWHGQQGTALHRYGSVGRIEMQGGYVQPQMVVRSPADGVVAVDNGVEGSFVTAGTQLAVAYDSSAVYVTARVDETDIDKVQLGHQVDLEVDAYPGAHLTGRVVGIKTGAAGVFSLFPQSNSTGNFQKVTQVIPVKIAFDDLQGLPLVPGMNVTARIHRN